MIEVGALNLTVEEDADAGKVDVVITRSWSEAQRGVDADTQLPGEQRILTDFSQEFNFLVGPRAAGWGASLLAGRRILSPRDSATSCHPSRRSPFPSCPCLAVRGTSFREDRTMRIRFGQGHSTPRMRTPTMSSTGERELNLTLVKNSNRQLKAKRSHLARAHAEAGPPIGRVRAIRAMVARRIGVGEHFLVRRLVLFLVALCYLAAFASLRDQWRGLFGRNGVTPVDALLAQVQKNGGLSSLVDRIWTMPTLLWLGDTPSVDAMGEAMCSAGAVLSVTAASLALFTRGGGSSIVFGALWGMYLSLFHVGQVFLSFQWDILLLEVGFCVHMAEPEAEAHQQRSSAPRRAVVAALHLLQADAHVGRQDPERVSNLARSHRAGLSLRHATVADAARVVGVDARPARGETLRRRGDARD